MLIKHFVQDISHGKKLFRPNNGGMNDNEVMGLIGELLFMQDYMIPHYGVDMALDSWMGPEKTHKDYSTESVWYEIKAISAGKDSVKISSLEQLDGDDEGYLAIYCLEKDESNIQWYKIECTGSKPNGKNGDSSK